MSKENNRKSSRYLKIIISILASYTIFAVPVYAYIDPSVTTYLIQAGAGIVIALGAAIGIYFRRAKRKVYDKFNIDDNKGKEVESDDIIINSNDTE